MDNAFFYGEYEIIGNAPLEPYELEFPISYSRSIERNNPDYVYLQYGLIYLETDITKYNKYLEGTNSIYSWDGKNPFRRESIGFETPDFDEEADLRSLKNKNIKHEIFAHFGLDADKSYWENYKNYEII